MISVVSLPNRSTGKTAGQVRNILYEVEKNPAVKIDVWSPNENHAARLISIAEHHGIELEMTIPKKREGTDLWVSKVHSIKRKEVI